MSDGAAAHVIPSLGEEYTLLGELGRGGSAIVYWARDRDLLRDVAIKVVRPRFAGSDDEAIARLEREARTVARLQHPNIVTVHAVRRLDDGGVALIMQLVPGRTLKQAIQEDGPFDPERAERVLRDVAEALAFAHAHGVVHRDVKPENVFLDSSTGRAMLSDFGIAHSKEFDVRLTMTGAAIGTPAYMAPEQIDGGPANARSDLYSLGLVAWEMLTGVRPWADEALYTVIYKQKHEDLPAIDALRPGQVPPRLQYIVERMLQKKPAARWAGADGLLVALTNWMLPGDWAQWEASHKRRRERDALQPPVKSPARQSVEADTVKFVRPDGQWDLEALGIRPAGTVGPGESGTAEPEDEAPSWAVEPIEEDAPPVRRRVRTGVVAVAIVLVVVAGGATAMLYDRRLGPFASAEPSAADRAAALATTPPAGDVAAGDRVGGESATSVAVGATVAAPVLPETTSIAGAAVDTTRSGSAAVATPTPTPTPTSPPVPAAPSSSPSSSPSAARSVPATGGTTTGGTTTGSAPGSATGGAPGASTPTPVTARAVALRVAPGTVSINAGEVLRLTAMLLSDDGDSAPATQVSWRSGNSDIVTVDARGRITGVGAGTTVVMVRRGALSALATVTVRFPLVGQIDLSTSEAVVGRGEALKLRATLRDASGASMAPRPLVWSSSNDDVAIVNANGVVVGIAPGVATITVTVDAAIATTTVTVR